MQELCRLGWGWALPVVSCESQVSVPAVRTKCVALGWGSGVDGEPGAEQCGVRALSSACPCV